MCVHMEANLMESTMLITGRCRASLIQTLKDSAI